MKMLNIMVGILVLTMVCCYCNAKVRRDAVLGSCCPAWFHEVDLGCVVMESQPHCKEVAASFIPDRASG